MKTTLRFVGWVSLFVLLAAQVGFAQTTWASINDTDARCTFSIPTNYSSNSAEQTNAYLATAGDYLLEAHFVNTDNMPSVDGQNFATNVAATGLSSRYDQMVQALAQVTNGQVAYQINLTIDGRSCREAAVQYTNDDDVPSEMYVRFVWSGNRIYTFSATTPRTANITGDSRRANAVAVFFDSIQFY
jgi:hypothetical protein